MPSLHFALILHYLRISLLLLLSSESAPYLYHQALSEVRALRAGTAEPKRDAGGYRNYNEQEVLLLTQILSTILFLLGFSGLNVS